MEGVFKRFGLEVGEEKKVGEARVGTFEYKVEKENSLDLFRMIRDGNSFMRMENGKYVRMYVGDQLVMSDTRMEKNSNREFVNKANGRVFIAGLGIGMIVHNLKEKVKTGEVTEIVVMEISQDVVDLISPYFEDLPIRYIVADVLDYLPEKGDMYDTIYFDIWPTITTDNLPEMAKLHNRWKNRKNRSNPKCWMGSWMNDHCKKMRAEENRGYGYW